MDQVGLSQSADEFAVAAVELVIQEFDAGAVTAEQSDHGAFVIFEHEDIALDDVIEAVVLGEESDAFVDDESVVEDEPVFIHPADPDAIALAGDIAVVHDIAWAVRTMCSVFGR